MRFWTDCSLTRKTSACDVLDLRSRATLEPDWLWVANLLNLPIHYMTLPRFTKNTIIVPINCVFHLRNFSDATWNRLTSYSMMSIAPSLTRVEKPLLPSNSMLDIDEIWKTNCRMVIVLHISAFQVTAKEGLGVMRCIGRNYKNCREFIHYLYFETITDLSSLLAPEVN